MKEILGITKNNIAVYLGDETRAHLEAHKNVNLDDVKEAISLIVYQEPFQIGEVQLSHSVGFDNCIFRYEAKGPVVGLRRKARKGLTPVTFEAELKPTNTIVIGICTDDDGKETLFTAFTGCLAPKEPWDSMDDPKKFQESCDFWSKHCLFITEDEICDEDKIFCETTEEVIIG